MKTDLDQLEALENSLCSDGSCVFRSEKYKGGQHTNGGCHCLDGLSYEQRRSIRRVFNALPHMIAELRAARNLCTQQLRCDYLERVCSQNNCEFLPSGECHEGVCSLDEAYQLRQKFINEWEALNEVTGEGDAPQIPKD